MASSSWHLHQDLHSDEQPLVSVGMQGGPTVTYLIPGTSQDLGLDPV